MAELTHERLTEAKAAVTERLAGLRLSRWHLRAVDRRLETYCRAVMTRPAEHNLWEQLSVERFLRMCERYGLDVDAVRGFFAFYEQLTFTGPSGPTHFRLTPVQCFQFASIYGFRDQSGLPVTREAVLFVPRKFSKTTSSAAFAVWDLLFGDANAESYTGANSADQAKKCFDVIRGAVLALDPRGHLFTVNEESIRSVMAGRTAKAQCLTANARTKDGLNASTIVMDEFSQARDSGLLNVLTTSMGTRRSPLTVIITTASDVYDGPFYAMLQGYKRLLLGEYEDDTVFVHLFEPDVGDDEADPATWRKVHPHMGVTVTEKFYRLEWLKAQRNGADALMAFRTKLLNQYFTNAGRQWVTRKDLRPVLVPKPTGPMAPGTVAAVGVDLSRCNDLTAVTTAYYNQNTYRVTMVTDYFFPAGALPGHTDEELFRRMAAEGHLHLIDGPVIDYSVITAHIRAIAERVPIVKVGYDPNMAAQFANELRAYGFGPVMWSVPQGYGYFAGPVLEMEKRIKEGSLRIDDNPLNEWCFGNCVVAENAFGCKPEKKSAAAKIDGVIAMLMALRSLIYWKR